MNETQEKQVAMHKDFFDRCRFAIDHGFYMEALLMEYAAVESRLEIILGVVGLPCNKQLDAKLRTKINISHRIACLRSLVESHRLFQTSKLDKAFLSKLSKWIDKRNQYIHGLYKNEIAYKQRMANAKDIAENGYEYCKALYNETHRLRRISKKHPDFLDDTIDCQTPRCCAYKLSP